MTALSVPTPEEHEALLFQRAYPPTPKALLRAERGLAGFARRVARLRKAGADLAAFEEPEVSGIAGTAFSAIFSYEVAKRLLELEPGRLEIDWERYEATDRMAMAWRRLFPLVEEDTMVEAHVPYLEWLRRAAGGLASALAWLISRLEALPIPAKDKAELYASLELPLRWDLGDSQAARTVIALPRRKNFYHQGPLIRRSEVLLEQELASAPLPIKRLNVEGGQAFLNMALATSAVRYRELHGFTFGDPNLVIEADAGRGVDIFLCGVPEHLRLPLRAYHAAMIFKNGVPVGYAETLSLFDRMEVGFNVYYTFRDGETAWIFARVLHLFHQILATTSFAIDPYQIGLGNPEGVASGAFWFYRKLGFRPVLPEVARLVAAEECKMLRVPGYRTPAGTLRRLAAGQLVFEMPGAPQGDWDSFSARNVALAAQGESPEDAVASVSRDLGIKAGPHPEFARLALVLDLIPDLADWPRDEKAALLDIIRAKMGPDESLYVRLMQKHARLREAIRELGQVGSTLG